MSTVRGLACNGCGALMSWVRQRGEGFPDKQTMERLARVSGWNAPDKIGKHWCPACRRPDGRRGWTKRGPNNV